METSHMQGCDFDSRGSGSPLPSALADLAPAKSSVAHQFQIPAEIRPTNNMLIGLMREGIIIPSSSSQTYL
jgi:hypothetical protein